MPHHDQQRAAPSRSADEPRVLQRVVMPIDRDLDVLGLYVESDAVHAAALDEPDGDTADTGEAGAAPSARILSRRALGVPTGVRASLCSYFNAFPAAYWRRWSVLEEVTLRVRVRGEGAVLVYRSTANGHVQRLKAMQVNAERAIEKEIRLPLAPFIDGGWYWIELVAGARTLVLEQAEWCAETDRPQGRTTIGITTFNRPKFCLDQLTVLSRAADVLDVIDEIIVVDQGTDLVRAQPGFPAIADALGDRLRLIEQANLGGSGGFSRAMIETLRSERADYVLLLDDDVVTEPESILRAVAFGDLARTPTIVGGHMFDLYDRPVLHAYAETVAQYRWWMVPARHTDYWHNLAHHTLRRTEWMHHRPDADFNGWWMCLIPVDVLRKIGLSFPAFIKWDDIEYGLRAKAAGISTVPMPGVAVWHVPWRYKDNALDWQAYFQERNRLAVALVHSPYDRGGNMLKESFIWITKHAMAMQYSTAALMLKAVEDALSGPDHLHATIAGKMAELRELRAEFIDTETRADLDQFPEVRRRRPPRKGREIAPPEGPGAMVRAAITGALRHLRPVDDFLRRHPQTTVPQYEQQWWRLAKLDSAIVSSWDGTLVSWYQRDPRRFRSLIWRNLVLHLRAYVKWRGLAASYRAALPALTSPEQWQLTLDSAVLASPASPISPASPGSAAPPPAAPPHDDVSADDDDAVDHSSVGTSAR